jgi:DNA-binding IclR family transcriptional regulator
MLANLPGMDIRKLFHKKKLERRTPNTITSVSGLLEELSTIREKGYAIDDEELALGVRCIAVPIFNYTGNCIAAISIAGPSVRMTVEKIKEIKPDIMAVGKTISIRLGHME